MTPAATPFPSEAASRPPLKRLPNARKIAVFREIGKNPKNFKKLVEVRDKFGYNTIKLVEGEPVEGGLRVFLSNLRLSKIPVWRGGVRVAASTAFSARLY